METKNLTEDKLKELEKLAGKGASVSLFNFSLVLVKIKLQTGAEKSPEFKTFVDKADEVQEDTLQAYRVSCYLEALRAALAYRTQYEENKPLSQQEIAAYFRGDRIGNYINDTLRQALSNHYPEAFNSRSIDELKNSILYYQSKKKLCCLP